MTHGEQQAEPHQRAGRAGEGARADRGRESRAGRPAEGIHRRMAPGRGAGPGEHLCHWAGRGEAEAGEKARQKMSRNLLPVKAVIV